MTAKARQLLLPTLFLTPGSLLKNLSTHKSALSINATPTHPSDQPLPLTFHTPGNAAG